MHVTYCVFAKERSTIVVVVVVYLYSASRSASNASLLIVHSYIIILIRHSLVRPKGEGICFTVCFLPAIRGANWRGIYSTVPVCFLS